MKYYKSKLISTAAILALSACGVLPASGPYSGTFSENAKVHLSSEKAPKDARLQYALVDISKNVATYLSLQPKDYPLMTDWPKDQGSNLIAVNVGDTIQITIYESRTGGLFVPEQAGVRPGNFVSLPLQTIDKTGIIKVPYAGEIQVIGKTPSEIGKIISEKLAPRAIEPEVVVSISGRGGSEISVIGEVTTPKRYSLSFSDERILDAIARAGGPTNPGYETYVTLQRKNREWTIPFDMLVLEPKKNIRMRPEDTVYLYREPEMCQIFGASAVTGAIPFTKRLMTLADVLGRAGGANDNRADPTEVYLYRQEKKRHLETLGVKLDGFDKISTSVPVIYKLNLRDPAGFFLTQKFPVQNNDIIYIANAESVEFIKFLDLLNSTSITKMNTKNAIEN
jgi:polysaccharide export outer membrane protein